MEDTWSAAAPIGVNRGVTLFLNDSLKNSQIISYPRYATIFASVCAILFIIIGILGKFHYFQLNIKKENLENF